MFRFAHPEYLWLLTLVGVMWLLYIVQRVATRRRLARFGEKSTVSELMPDRSMFRQKFKFFLFILAFIFVVFAAARPQFGSKIKEERAKGIEMMLVVDVSNSMLAEDFEPSRLERTKYAI